MYKFTLYRILKDGQVKSDPLWENLSADEVKKIIHGWIRNGCSFSVEVDI